MLLSREVFRWAAGFASRFVLLALAFVLLVPCFAGCRRDSDEADSHSPSSPRSKQLPPFELTDETPSILLTWVDEKGDFHTCQKIGDVPENARAQVRVVQTTRVEGTGQLLYVADLREKQGNAYRVTTMTRAQWDEVGAERRQARLEALAPSAAPSTKPPKVAPDQLEVVVYGADWCGPCHDAERYLKRRGVRVEKKDIEKDSLARSELERKLRHANLPSSTRIPIIDVGGQLLVGFNPSALDRALRTAQASETI